MSTSDGVSILVVDNYDSFVFNLVQYLGQLGAECVVRRNDEVSARDAAGVDGRKQARSRYGTKKES